MKREEKMNELTTVSAEEEKQTKLLEKRPRYGGSFY